MSLPAPRPIETDATRAARLLAELGSTPWAVAASLARLKVRGMRGKPRGCPLWVYLGESGIPVERVDPDDLTLWGGERGGVRLPPPCKWFVRLMDGGRFPALEAT